MTAREGTTETTSREEETPTREEETTAREGTTETTAIEKETTASVTVREEETARTKIALIQRGLKRPAAKADGYAIFQMSTDGKKSMPFSVPENEVANTAKNYVKQGYSLTVVETRKLVNYEDCLNALKTVKTKEIWAAKGGPMPQIFTKPRRRLLRVHQREGLRENQNDQNDNGISNEESEW